MGIPGPPKFFHVGRVFTMSLHAHTGKYRLALPFTAVETKSNFNGMGPDNYSVLLSKYDSAVMTYAGRVG